MTPPRIKIFLLVAQNPPPVFAHLIRGDRTEELQSEVEFMPCDIENSYPMMATAAASYGSSTAFGVFSSATSTPAWLWMAVVTIIVSWSAFLYALTRRLWNLSGLIVGVFHMFFAATLSFAPFRSWFDPNYLGLSLGFLHFAGHRATFPCALMLGWTLAAALVAVTKGVGRGMILLLAGDAFWALNFGGSLLLGEAALKSKIQLGDEATFTGAWALLILLTFYVLPFVLSTIWAARHLRDAESSLSDKIAIPHQQPSDTGYCVK